jgi:DNA-binding Xre family transcriptional regulator
MHVRTVEQASGASSIARERGCSAKTSSRGIPNWRCRSANPLSYTPILITRVLISQDIYDRIFDVEVSNTKLRRLRQERAWSIRELSERAGVSTETIYSLEHGRREWAWPRTIRKLAEALDVEPRELMKGD